MVVEQLNAGQVCRHLILLIKPMLMSHSTVCVVFLLPGFASIELTLKTFEITKDNLACVIQPLNINANNDRLLQLAVDCFNT